MSRSKILASFIATNAACSVVPFLAVSAARPSFARADELSDRVSATAELGAGGTLTRFRQADSVSGNVLQLGLRANLDLLPKWALTFAIRSWSLPSNNTAVSFSPGVRYDAWSNPLGLLRTDAAVGLAATGGGTKIGFDLGAAFEFYLPPVPGMTLGPVIRYMQAINSGAYGDDGKAFSIGASLTYHFGIARAAAAGASHVTRIEIPRVSSVASLVDTDNDGIKDDRDLCPNMAPGKTPDPERPGCPLGDRDGDGIPDNQDICPDDAVTNVPDLGRRGCPAPDTDRDGVRDAEDSCPDKPGVPSTDVKENGCPSQLVAVSPGKLEIKKPISFASGKDVLLPESNEVLDAVAGTLKASPQVKKIAIQGHTDNQGNGDKNLELSQRRAEAVRNALIQRGVAADRLEAQGFGATQPVASNKTAAGRATNRRVEFVLVE
jgi:outer membrane protein OmpA-like peptidoglycan-associated protein